VNDWFSCGMVTSKLEGSRVRWSFDTFKLPWEISKGIYRLALVATVSTLPPETLAGECMLSNTTWFTFRMTVHALLQVWTCGNKGKTDE
jgi:hypothetical protein